MKVLEKPLKKSEIIPNCDIVFDEIMMNSAIDRALELFDLSINATKKHGELRELCRARETFCDFFFNENSFHTNPENFQAYFDQFVGLSS